MAVIGLPKGRAKPEHKFGQLEDSRINKLRSHFY